ncbi:MAG: hypothetical protein VX254_04335 [Planctomycetota bacterium]|nr:hypothetical protein [Planctomycetota bacterium]
MKDKNTPTNPERAPTPQEELVAYLDGELDNPGRERVEALLAEDPALQEALKQHEAIAEALAAPQADDGPGARETLARIHARIHGRQQHSRTKITTMVLAVAASLVLAVLIGTRLFTGPRGPANPAGTQLANPVENPVFQPEVLADLDVLEVLQEEGGEISLELVNLLLEEDGGTGVLDSGLFNDWLEEEITGENF